MTGTIKIKKDTMLMFSEGERSDYIIFGVFCALQDFDIEEEKEKYLEERPDQKIDYQFNYREFVSVLITRGFIDRINYHEVYLGAYGKVKIDISGNNSDWS